MFLCRDFMQTITGTDIIKAASLLKQGELVAVPTETVYGLAANALDEEAVLKIYHAKNRPRFNPLILHVASFEKLKQYAEEIPADCIKLAEKFSPGPITFLLKKKDSVPDLVTAGSKKVAIRIPNHSMLTELLKQIDFPLAAPSANPSGYVSPVTAQHVLEGLNEKIPYILDGGECTVISLNKQFSNLTPAFQFQLSSSGDLDEAARNLFSVLRKADEMKTDLIIADKMPDKELGAAINDRLQRAQHENKIDQP